MINIAGTKIVGKRLSLVAGKSLKDELRFLNNTRKTKLRNRKGK